MSEASVSEAKRVVLVGHCGPDAYALRSAVASFVPGAEVTFARHDGALREALESAALLLVNRTLDGDFADGSGIDLIRRLAVRGPGGPRLMLISNLAEAQQEAEGAGAVPGFGKRAMYSEEARARIRAALGLA